MMFSDILEVPNIVLLGEPGSGQTYLFEFASQYEQGNYTTARSFIIHADDSYIDKRLYIDALDEKRSRVNNIDSISEIIKHVKQIKPSSVRVSCRASDWLGETDLELFKPYFETSGGYCVVALEKLTENEIDRILNPSFDSSDKNAIKNRRIEFIKVVLWHYRFDFVLKMG